MFQLGYPRGIIVLHGDVETPALESAQLLGRHSVAHRGNRQRIVSNQKRGDELLLVLRFNRENGLAKLLREGFQVVARPDGLQIGQKEVLQSETEKGAKQYSR